MNIKRFLRRIESRLLKKEKAKSDAGNITTLLKEKLNLAGLVKGLIIFDVGAYKGDFSIQMLSCFPASKIYAFEPVSGSFARLKEAVKRYPEIECFQLAVGAQQRSSSIHLNQYGETNSLLPSAKTDSYIDDLTTTISNEMVEMKAIDEICENLSIPEIDFLKVDVQGYELEVLKGAECYLSNRLIKFVLCEIEFIEIYKGQPLVEDIIKYFRNFDYKPIWITNVNYIKKDQLGWADMLFTKS